MTEAICSVGQAKKGVDWVLNRLPAARSVEKKSVDRGRIVLLAGDTGNFGRKIVHHRPAMGCSHVRILSREKNKQESMRFANTRDMLRVYTGDGGLGSR